jgi:alkaline phosphatase D
MATLFRCGLLAALLCTIVVPVASQQPTNNADVESDPDGDWSRPEFWETLDGQPVEQSWDFVDGELRLERPRGGNGSLLSPALPDHFELSWNWKIAPKSNTGLKYRVRKYGGRWLGIEYQIIDDRTFANQPETGKTAAIYDLFAPSAQESAHPPGQWNHSKIIASGNRLEHYLNGNLACLATTEGPVWDRQIALSKFWDADDFGRPQGENRIMLTDHGGQAAYKDFRFVVQQPAKTTESRPASGPFLGNAIRNSWADQTSIVLWTRTTARPEIHQAGLDFVAIPKDKVGQYNNLTDADKLLRDQLPSGADLADMCGACPGQEGEVRLTYFPVLQRKKLVTTDWVPTRAEDDFTAQWKLEDLLPDRQYAAVVEARPIGATEPTAVVRGSFRTAPDNQQSKAVKFCMTTCHDFIRRDDGWNGHKIYPSMMKLSPDFVVHAGDIEYYDKPDPWAWTIELMRFKWGRIFGLPNNRQFYQTTTSYFLKDDHDTLKNDCWRGQRYGAVSFEQGLHLFNHEQFPSRSPRYQTVRWGKDLQFWLLEGRDYRSPNNMPDGPDKTILGVEQKEWLRESLSRSDARFKLVFSPTPIVGPDRDNKRDNHANDDFAHEGNELRQLFSSHDGVIVFCGDRHWQYASVDNATGLWEFGCGPGSEKHELGWKPGDQRPVHRFLRVAGGFLSGELRYDDGDRSAGTLVLQHRTVEGDVVSEFRFPIEPADAR